MKKLVLIRHGQSEWNLENRFTGWKDVKLSEKGLKEARAAGQLLKEQGFKFDAAFTSVLRRAIHTLWLTLEEMDQMWVPVTKAWQLNERHYGGLTGLNKAETADKYGDEQVHIWRRSFDTPPPALEESSEYHPKQDDRYAELTDAQKPATESLKLTLDRVLPYWEEKIVPVLKNSECMIIAAHGNSLRALIKHLDQVSDDEITSIEIPTGDPLVYELNDDLSVIRSYYLREEAAKTA